VRDDALVVGHDPHVIADVARAGQLLGGGTGEIGCLDAGLVEDGGTGPSRAHVR
jgi:hypothetical protein